MSATHALQRATGARAIAAKYSEKLARAFDCGDAHAAYAARARYQLEEAIEMAQFDLAAQKTGETSRHSQLAVLSTAQKSERRALSERHRHERAHLAIILRAFAPARRAAASTRHRWRTPVLRRFARRRKRYQPSQGR